MINALDSEYLLLSKGPITHHEQLSIDIGNDRAVDRSCKVVPQVLEEGEAGSSYGPRNQNCRASNTGRSY